MGNMVAAAGPKAPKAIMRAVNRTGDMAYTQMVRSLTKQSGMKHKVIRKALKKSKSWTGSSAGAGARDAYVIHSQGGNVRLKYFKARETRKGVTAAPWNRRRLYAQHFIKAGRYPHRVGWQGGGHVYKREGSKRAPIVQVRSGLYIPDEMIKGASRDAFFSTIQSRLPERLRHELLRILAR